VSYAAASMAPRPFLGATALGLLVATACGGRSPLPVPDCDAPALTFCQTDGCPFLGPAASTATAITAWCSASGAFSARVTGYGTCLTPAGLPWAIDVKATDTHGNTHYALYDPVTAQLLSVSTLAPGDGGMGETDYGTCGENTGIVTCSSVVFACDR